MPDQSTQSIHIDAPPAAVMAVIADFDHYPQWAGSVKRAEVLATGRDGRAEHVRFTLDAGPVRDTYELSYVWQGDEQFPTVGEPDRPHRLRTGVQADGLVPTGHVPHPHAAVGPPARQPAAVRAVPDRGDRGGVPDKSFPPDQVLTLFERRQGVHGQDL